MTDISAPASAPVWPRLVGALGLLWNLYGVYEYLVTVGIVGTAAGVQPTTADTIPAWVTAAFAVAVFAGALGSLFLLLLNRWAVGLLVISLFADLLWDLRMVRGGDHGSAIGLVASVTLIGILLAWTSYWASKKGILS